MSEKVIEKSRFLTCVAHVSNEDEAKGFLSELHDAHKTATHICYGYIADTLGNLQRYSDDGEPQGTAGLPILGVIRSKGLFETAVAVVRYFGGVKLGAGGLTRAYANCAAEGLEAARVCEYDTSVKLVLSVNYSEVNALAYFLEKRGIHECEKSFAERAEFTLAVRERDLEAFRADLSDRLQGRVTVTETERTVSPFDLN